MKQIFVSGCYDILHAGHVQFFKDARALGDHLTVCFASAEVLWNHKQRRSSLPVEHKRAVLESLSMVDQVVMGEGTKQGLDFEEHFLALQPDCLVVTTDDHYGDLKRELCSRVGAEYHILEKSPPQFEPITTSELVRWIRAPQQAPLRVDFAGGWLDVPRFARPGAFIVNCTISPLVSLRDWTYRVKAGLGGSGAYALLQGDSGVQSELELGVGWQDPAVISETGLCVWKSGQQPELDFKRNVDLLEGRMALRWLGTTHDTPGVTENQRNYDLIEQAGNTARNAVLADDLEQLAAAVGQSYQAQLQEGMDELPSIKNALASRYCGGGWGGYALYLFGSTLERDEFANTQDAMAVEPYIRQTY